MLVNVVCGCPLILNAWILITPFNLKGPYVDQCIICSIASFSFPVSMQLCSFAVYDVERTAAFGNYPYLTLIFFKACTLGLCTTLVVCANMQKVLKIILIRF